MNSHNLDFEITDVTGFETKFRKLSDVKRFLKLEHEAWSWLEDAPHSAVDMRTHVYQHIQLGEQWVSQLEQAQISDENFIHNFRSLYQTEDANLILSESERGQAILHVLGTLGPDAAERGLAMLMKRLTPYGNVYLDAKVWQILLNPALIDFNARLGQHSNRLSALRREHVESLNRFDSEAKSAIERLSSAQNEEIARHHRSIRASNRYARWIARKTNAAVEEAVARIHQTDLVFAEKMRLQAPVRYWKVKGKAHADAAQKWLATLCLFVLLSGLGTWAALSHIWELIDDREGLSGKHFLLVAGIGSFLTMLFWIARVLMKIYLGERHLSTDAEERRVMTMTYLALLSKSAAEPDERILVLSSLFRSAQDGIVKDDGGADLSLPAVLAKMLDSKPR